MAESFRHLVTRLRRWIRDDAEPGPPAGHEEIPPGPGHAAGHRHLGPPPDVPEPHSVEPAAGHDQPWVPTGGLTDRQRRSERRE